MGLIDAFAKEDRTEIRMTQLCDLIRAGVKSDLIMNAVNCDVPHQYISEMVTGEKEVLLKETGKQGGEEAGELGLASAT